MMRLRIAYFLVFLTICALLHIASSRNIQNHRRDSMKNCVSKFYNRELGPLEILMLPLGEKLWLRAWLGNHMTNLLHMEGVDLAEVTNLTTEENRKKRSNIFTHDNKNWDVTFPKHFSPKSYKVALKPNFQEDTFEGLVQINLTCLEATNKIIVNFGKELTMKQHFVEEIISSDGMSSCTRLPWESYEGVTISTAHNQIEIEFKKNLTGGVTYQLGIQFEGKLLNESNTGFYYSIPENSTSDTRDFLLAHMKNGYAKNVFPCYDDPSYKATFEISIARPVNMKSISTMAIRTSEPNTGEDDYVWDHFQITPPMPISSLAVFIYNPENLLSTTPTFTKGGVEIKGLAQAADLSKAQDIVNSLMAAINYMERHLGVPYPLPQMHVVPLSNSSVPSKDYWGLFLVGNDFQTPVYLLQQWFDQLLTPETSYDEILLTALAKYFTFICAMKVGETCEFQSIWSSEWGPRYSYTTQYDPSSKHNPQQARLHKFIRLFRMLNYSLTERVFKNGVQTCLKTRAYGIFTAHDLWNSLDQQAWTYATLERNISTKQIANSWLNKESFPVVTVIRNYTDNTATLAQEVFSKELGHSVPNVLWWIPITFLYQDNLDIEDIGMITWMKEREIRIEYLPNSSSFIIINPEDIGMFLVNYDKANWNILAKYLTASGAEDGKPLIPSATRAKLLHDAWYLALGGRLDFATALNMSLFLKTETEASVWKTLAHVYFKVSWKLIGTPEETKFDRFIGELLLHMYNKDGDTNPVEYEASAEVHDLAHYVLSKAGHKEAVERARVQFSKWLQDQKEMSDGMLWGVFRWVDEDWDRGLEAVIQNEIAQEFRSFFLSQLVSSAILPCKVERILFIVLLEDENNFSDEEVIQVVSSVYRYKTFLHFLKAHWTTIMKRFESREHVWQCILKQATGNFKTQEGYNMVLDFYTTHKDEIKILSVIEYCLSLTALKKEGPSEELPGMTNWLDNYLAQSEAHHLFYTVGHQ